MKRALWIVMTVLATFVAAYAAAESFGGATLTEAAT